MAIFKAQAHMRELKQRLSILLSGKAQKDSTDLNGMPQLELSASGEQIFIKIQPLADFSQHVDGIGLAQRVYSPHECLILREEAASASDPSARETVFAACAKLGMRVTVKEGSGVGSAASYSAAESLASSTAVSLPSDEVNKLTVSQ